MPARLAEPAGPLGLDACLTDFAVKAGNLTRGPADRRFRVIEAVARAAAY